MSQTSENVLWILVFTILAAIALFTSTIALFLLVLSCVNDIWCDTKKDILYAKVEKEHLFSIHSSLTAKWCVEQLPMPLIWLR